MIFHPLQAFRQTLYNSLGNARDAIFDLMDAVLVSASIVSFVSLSQSPVFRRQWSSVYAAVQDSRLPQAKVRKLLVSQIPPQTQPLLAGDGSRWNRPAAKTLKDRTFAGGTGERITVGHSYSTLAWIPEASGSWVLPLCHERITSFETPASRAACQLKQVTRQLPVRPLVVYDRGYGSASFVKQTAAIEADLLLRLASNRCVYGAPPAYGGRGAPAKHGHKMKLKAPETWSLPTESVEVEDPKLGRVRVTRWSAYHFQKSAQRPMEIIRVEILAPKAGKRRFTPLWLAWLGQTMPPAVFSQLRQGILTNFGRVIPSTSAGVNSSNQSCVRSPHPSTSMTQIETSDSDEIASSTLQVRLNFTGQFAHGFALEDESERIVHNPVKHRVS